MNTIILLTLSMVTIALGAAVVTATMAQEAFAARGEINNHISPQGRENISPDGAGHAGLLCREKVCG